MSGEIQKDRVAVEIWFQAEIDRRYLEEIGSQEMFGGAGFQERFGMDRLS